MVRKGFFYPAVSAERVPLPLRGMNMKIKYVLAMPCKNISPFWKYQKLESLNPQPMKILFCENNSSDDTVKLLRKVPNSEYMTFQVDRDWKNKATTSYDIVARARQMLLERARELEPECLLFLDADTIPGTPDLVPRMAYRGKDIVGGAYIRTFENGVPCIAAYWEGGVRKQEAIYPFDDTVYVVGGGCMLIGKKLLMDKDINFIPVPEDGTSEDYAYCQKALKKGYTIGLDSSVMMLHYYDDEYGQTKDWSLRNIKQPKRVERISAWSNATWFGGK
jgi:cellulose synthase/poly-beta-1,6-N-acetylglucosamine synthase-like glycosyltransferase